MPPNVEQLKLAAFRPTIENKRNPTGAFFLPGRLGQMLEIVLLSSHVTAIGETETTLHRTMLKNSGKTGRRHRFHWFVLA